MYRISCCFQLYCSLPYYHISPCFKLLCHKTDILSPLYCFLSRFQWGSGLCFTNPNNCKFTKTILDVSRLMLHCHWPRSETVADRSFSVRCPEEPVAWEHINRVLEQLKALFQDKDKTPCARDELSPHKDLVLGHSKYFHQLVTETFWRICEYAKNTLTYPPMVCLQWIRVNLRAKLL